MSPPRILVVDDSLTSRTLVQLSFKGQAVQLDFAVSGQEGLHRAAQASPDLVLLDYMLPDMRGSDFCRTLQAQAATQNTPVIVISAKEQGLRAAFAGCHNVVDYLGKPFSAADVQARTQAALRPVQAATASIPAATPARSHAQKQALAQALYGVLRPQLQAIPGWMGELGTAAPGPFFAAKILTPERVDALLATLEPLLAAAAPVDSLEAERVYVRAPGFASRVAQLAPGSREQRLLTAMDGQLPLAGVAAAAGVNLTLAAATVQGLLATGLVSVAASGAVRVLLVVPQASIWADGLQSMLQEMRPALQLTVAADASAAQAALQATPPQVLCVVGCIGAPDLAALAAPTGEGVLRVALAEAPRRPGDPPAAWASAYDAVLHPPLLRQELEQLFVSVRQK